MALIWRKVVVESTTYNFTCAASAMMASAMADGKPVPPGVWKSVCEQGFSSAVPSNPNSRQGRFATPFMQGQDTMEAMIKGIDVAGSKLDVSVRPTGEDLSLTGTQRGLID